MPWPVSQPAPDSPISQTRRIIEAGLFDGGDGSMADMDLIVDPEQRGGGGVPRRTFIKGVIAAGAAVSSAGYLFRSSGVVAQPATRRWR